MKNTIGIGIHNSQSQQGLDLELNIDSNDIDTYNGILVLSSYLEVGAKEACSISF